MESILMGTIGIIVTIFTGLFGIIFKRLSNMDSRLRDAPSRREVSEEIEVRQESLKVLQQEIKEDIKEMKRTLEKLLTSH